MSQFKNFTYALLLCIMVSSAVLIVAWIVLLKDYSYAVIAVPVSFVGLTSWCIASLIRWQHWFAVMLGAYILPFLPWVDWMYG